MNIQIKATGIELTPAISAYADKKIGALAKHINKPEEVVVTRVELGKTTRHHKEGFVFRAEVHITGAGLDVYAVNEAEDLYAAIDLVEAETARELESKKGKQEKLFRRSGRAFKDAVRGFSDKFRRK